MLYFRLPNDTLVCSAQVVEKGLCSSIRNEDWGKGEKERGGGDFIALQGVKREGRRRKRKKETLSRSTSRVARA